MDQETPERLLQERFMAPNTLFHLFKHRLDRHIPVHWHEFFEIALVQSGTGTHILNGINTPLRKKCLYLLTPADFHEIVPDNGETVCLYNAIFVQRFIRQELFQWIVQDCGGISVELTDEDYASVEAEFGRMWHETENSRQGGEWIVAGALERVLVELMRNYSGSGENRVITKGSLIHPSISKAVTYLQYHFRDPVTLDSVAKQTGLSANYFSECFSKQLGIPFQLYLQDLRLKFAHSLLGMTKLPITEICYASGFGTLSHFERSFKRKYNQTPRQTRSEAAP